MPYCKTLDTAKKKTRARVRRLFPEATLAGLQLRKASMETGAEASNICPPRPIISTGFKALSGEEKVKIRPLQAISFVICLLLAWAAASAENRGPVPPALTAARSVFIPNGGSDSGLFPQPFSGDTDRAYAGFYGGRYETQLRRWNDDAEALPHVLRS
jgi:hypothetical protein